ncbi:putative ribosome biogenesis protein [Podospora fimiseda]|uniref:Ribosome biogenesis protein n=1 Tax=Podospora fimiseda TaxID=252190 RepID=A0AAN7H1V7_9PEZI|nr:putative ribosome biogenesis protein [Podospora fimiseda]
MGAKRTKDKKKATGNPTFDENALAALTSKIDKTLGGSGETANTKRKRQRDTDDGPGPDSKRRQIKTQNKQQHKGGKKDKQSVLLDEILALGGDEDDLELVANVDSDNEESSEPKPKQSQDTTVDESLRNELAQFASSLGFQKLRAEVEDVATDEEEEPEDEENEASEVEDEEAEDEEMQDVEEEPEPASAPPPQETCQGKKGKLIFEPRPDWHALSTNNLPSAIPENAKPQYASVANLKAYAQSLLDQDSASYSAMQASSSTQKFMATIMSSGTLSDKVSALTLSIQESPLHNRKPFESLITLAGKKSRGQAIAALGALVDLLGNGSVLPSDRRLRIFSAQPALIASLQNQGSAPWTKGQRLPGKLTDAHLMMWAYEDWLKESYFKIIQLLEVWCSDEIEYSRSRALDFVFGLLKSKPEQEANLLRLIVNKLGDRERKIASRASYLILQLLNLHPGMKAVVIKTVEQEVLLKPGQSIRTRYYAINTLNQTILSTKEPAIADTLVCIYFEAFLSLLKTGSLGDFEALEADKKPEAGPKKFKKRGGPKKTVVPGNEQETAQKLVSSLLTGVNRAIPFATADDSTLEKHLDTLFRITHSSNFNTSVQALMLIQQLAASKLLAVDRFYRTLYESLLDPRLVTSSKQALYLNLLYRALKNDVDVRRVKAFVKRLVQILSLHQASFACGILFLIAELHSTFPDLHTLLNEPEDNEEDEEEVYKDVKDDEPQAEAAGQQTETANAKRTGVYDGRKRNPEHSNAHRSCLWEVIPFLSHFHPSVGVFAANLFSRQDKLPKPDLANHTLIHFLDKFVYRNPKAEDSKRGGSIMQPALASGSAAHIVASNKAGTQKQKVVNSASFWNLKPEQVSAEDVFFHEYFTRMGKPAQAEKVKKPAKSEAAGSDDEEAEDQIWDALVNSRPEVEGPDDDEGSDIDMEDYEDSDEDLEAGGAALDEDMSDMGSDASDDGFQGIFEDSEASGDEDQAASDAEDSEEEEKAPTKSSEARKRRKKMKSLPTFASAEDYAEMLAGEEDGLDNQ